MKKFAFITGFIFLTISSMQAQQMFQKYSGSDIGNPKLKGNFQFDKKNQQFILEGAGYNIWFERDEFYFVAQEVEGDFILSANLEFLGEGVDLHRKIGLMIRNSKAENAVYMDGAVHGDGLTSLQYREKTGGETKEIASEMKAPEFIQVERKGNEYIFRLSKDGEPLMEVGRIKLDMSSSVFAGMFISSHNETVVEKARFWNVRLEKPANKDVDGYQTPSPSRMEILNIESGNREVIFETETHIEAPNWSRNGKFLVYNSGGKLYKFDLKKRKPEEINTGFATANNNDHGISFDGKTMAISHHTEENGKRHSIIYTVPLKGGTPKRVTEKGPSYWHGWSPDDQWHVYCAERNGNYDVYKIPAEGGEEIRLTTAGGLDDGPEYSPDGKFIYFNSVRSGSMEIWRMKPDGSDQEQVTDDEFQNWFAHPSPDGKWLIMISYLPEVPASSHPHNQRVMLRLMPANGGEIKTVAFLYGGQGTINVPSWSPDSKKVAFMSYTY
jgi:Tol biopolymer transport system component